MFVVVAQPPMVLDHLKGIPWSVYEGYSIRLSILRCEAVFSRL